MFTCVSCVWFFRAPMPRLWRKTSARSNSPSMSTTLDWSMWVLLNPRTRKQWVSPSAGTQLSWNVRFPQFGICINAPNWYFSSWFNSQLLKRSVPPHLSAANPCPCASLSQFGNTCYCNSVLQALYFCRPFRENVLAYKAQQKKKENLLTCLADLFHSIATQKKKVGVIPPKKFISRLRKENGESRGARAWGLMTFISALVIPAT